MAPSIELAPDRSTGVNGRLNSELDLDINSPTHPEAHPPLPPLDLDFGSGPKLNPLAQFAPSFEPTASLDLDLDAPTLAPPSDSDDLSDFGDLPSSLELPELPAPRTPSIPPETLRELRPGSFDSVHHEVQTAVYIIPDDIRAAAQEGAAPVLDNFSPADGEADFVDDDDIMMMGDDGGISELPSSYDDPFADAAAAMGGSLNIDGTFEALSDSPMQPPTDHVLGRLEAAALGVAVEAASPIPRDGVVLPQLTSESAARGGIGAKLVGYLAVAAVLGAGVLLYLGGGRIDLSLIGLRDPSKSPDIVNESYQEVYPVVMRSVTYEIHNGDEVLVFTGKVENRSGEPRENLNAIAELHDKRGQLVARGEGPVGVPLSPSEVAALTDRTSLTKAYQQKAAALELAPLGNGETAQFTVVLLNPPSSLVDLEHTVRLDKGQPLIITRPTAPESVLEPGKEEDPAKGKRKRKSKRKRGKRKSRME